MQPCFEDFLECLKDFQENRELFVTVSVLTAFKTHKQMCEKSPAFSTEEFFSKFESQLSPTLKCLADFQHYSQLMTSAESLCHLEAQVFLNEEQKAELPLLQTEWQRVSLEFTDFCHSKGMLPEALRGTDSAFRLRLFAAILISQKEWVGDVDFFAVDEASKRAIFLESPVFTVPIFLGEKA